MFPLRFHHDEFRRMLHRRKSKKVSRSTRRVRPPGTASPPLLTPPPGSASPGPQPPPYSPPTSSGSHPRPAPPAHGPQTLPTTGSVSAPPHPSRAPDDRPEPEDITLDRHLRWKLLGCNREILEYGKILYQEMSHKKFKDSTFLKFL